MFARRRDETYEPGGREKLYYIYTYAVEMMMTNRFISRQVSRFNWWRERERKYHHLTNCNGQNSRWPSELSEEDILFVHSSKKISSVNEKMFRLVRSQETTSHLLMDLGEKERKKERKEEIVLLQAQCIGCFLVFSFFLFFLSSTLFVSAHVSPLPSGLLIHQGVTSNKANSLLMFLPVSLAHRKYRKKSMVDCNMHLRKCTSTWMYTVQWKQIPEREEKEMWPVHNLHTKKSSYLPGLTFCECNCYQHIYLDSLSVYECRWTIASSFILFLLVYV